MLVQRTLVPSQICSYPSPCLTRDSKKESYLILGTSTGHLQLHNSEGQLLHRQRLHAKAVTAITVRCAGMQAGSDDASEDITICFTDAVARISSLEVLICSVHCGCTPLFCSIHVMCQGPDSPSMYTWCLTFLAMAHQSMHTLFMY